MYAFQEEPRIHSKPFCTKDQLNKIWDTIEKEVEVNCVSREPCNYEKYDIVSEEFSQSNETLNEPKGAILQFQLAGRTVEHRDSSLAYDMQSLISEIGGNLGLTLGISGMSLVDLFYAMISKFLPKL